MKLHIKDRFKKEVSFQMQGMYTNVRYKATIYAYKRWWQAVGSTPEKASRKLARDMRAMELKAERKCSSFFKACETIRDTIV